jgi:hypothetical protein
VILCKGWFWSNSYSLILKNIWLRSVDIFVIVSGVKSPPRPRPTNWAPDSIRFKSYSPITDLKSSYGQSDAPKDSYLNEVCKPEVSDSNDSWDNRSDYSANCLPIYSALINTYWLLLVLESNLRYLYFSFAWKFKWKSAPLHLPVLNWPSIFKVICCKVTFHSSSSI